MHTDDYLHHVIVDNDAVTIKVVETDKVPEGWDTDESTPIYLHQSTLFFFNFDLEANPDNIDFCRGVCDAVLQFTQEQAAGQGFGFELTGTPLWRWSRKAGCNTCPCSPGFLTGVKIMAGHPGSDPVQVDLYITLKDTRL